MQRNSFFRTPVPVILSGILKALSALIWILKILIPVGLGTFMLVQLGIMPHLEILLRPLMQPMGLPPAAALPLIIGMLTNIYGAIAVMVTLPLDTHTLTLIAIFLLIAHNLIQEGAVQHATGINGWLITLIRILAATLTVMTVAIWLPPETTANETSTAILSRPPFTEAFMAWAWQTFVLSAQILGILLVLMPCLEICKAMGITSALARITRPVSILMGIPRSTTILWLTAILFGLSYGAAVIMEEVKGSDIAGPDLEKLQVSIAINHSMVEDPALFLPLGLPAFWLWVPRIITALLFVQLLRLWQYFHSHTPPHPSSTV
ncbi:nucleoside recognition domain-containing protein [Desulfobotulus sp. H1]|uniref:Nucleoside recognition domain-containing protein n=1 Tax=Desulfobotulus pelophilus TaxID=2823377 RepID=A0ABT3N6S6_9BACT|nr:nucleoside recognition domain-containing protein [Desulfobotulus pelophilus]MCW7753161.1 nucleoside recognition domain-containing protein [Desulfobotulus pelophilus]